jgi:2-polyprenyl-6-methoxyphenol hydroxylase-like FAD-dependent oxidoreductase
VTLIERDELPAGATSRKGVPQGRHAHVLLVAGERVIRELLPGLMEELVEGGAVPAHWPEGRWWQSGGYRVPSGTDLDAVGLSRPFLEAGVRRRVLARPGVTVVTATARGLVVEGGRVTGVEVEDAGGRRVAPAGFVVDCSGRGSQAGAWLEAAGYPAPPVAEVRMDMAYASRVLHRAPADTPGGSWFVCASTPPVRTRGAVLFPIENDRWMLTLAGFHGDRPPTDDEGFLAFVRSLPTPDIASVVEAAAPDGPILPHRMPTSQWRHFEKVRRAPAGFVALGDAICSFNPIYGQGMATAALEARALGRVLDRSDPAAPATPRRFYRAAKKIVRDPWQIAVGNDFLLPETTGPKPPGTDLANWFVAKALIAAQRDPVVNGALIDIQNLLVPPPSIVKPNLVYRVFKASRAGPTGHPSTTLPSA